MTWHLHHGDCLDWLATLKDKSVDVTIADPPYSDVVHANVRSVSSAGSRRSGSFRRDDARAHGQGPGRKSSA